MDSFDADDNSRERSPQLEEEQQEHARPRKRTRRACDKCSTSRTRCDGQQPCRRCEDYGYTCRYNREVKKRGRVPTSTQLADEDDDERMRNSSEHQRRRRSSPPRRAAKRRRRKSSASSSTSDQPEGNHGNETEHNLTTGNGTETAQAGEAPASSPFTFASPQALASPSTSNGAYLQLSSMLDPPADSTTMAVRTPEMNIPSSIPPLGGASLGGDAAAAVQTSPLNGNTVQQHMERPCYRQTPRPNTDRSSFSTAAGAEGPSPSAQQHPSPLYRAPSSHCRYRFLDPVLPFIQDIIPASVACDLLDVYLTEPGSSLFRCASPYILTPIFRKEAMLHPTHPRPTTPALLATMLWCGALTADIVLLHVPGNRSRICNSLYGLATSLVSERDPDRWRRIHGGLRVENDHLPDQYGYASMLPLMTAANEPVGVVDDVLTFALLSIAVSGGDFKSDCLKWQSKAIRLSLALGLNREDERCMAAFPPCPNPLCACRRDTQIVTRADEERREERRRVFWLLYCLDRHLCLSFNRVLSLPDSLCEVYAPLPDTLWENFESLPELPPRILGPTMTVSGTGWFEYFLPLMAILGDIIDVHHRRQHPRLGHLDDSQAVAAITDLLSTCEMSIDSLPHLYERPHPAPAPLRQQQQQQQHHHHHHHHHQPHTNGDTHPNTTTTTNTGDANTSSYHSHSHNHSSTTHSQQQLQLVTAYSMHIVHVLHVLLHGKWDALSMLDDDGSSSSSPSGDDDWITSSRFTLCATHAIAASEAVARILTHDPELTFMPYLFGIYLLQGSFVLLLFADRMPQLGPNQSVEHACETIIRAHEVCVVTLSTEFQKNFRKVLRSTLYSVRASGRPTEWEEHRARRRALSLYRWTKGARGLGL